MSRTPSEDRKLIKAMEQVTSFLGSSLNDVGVTLGSDDVELLGRVPSGVIWASTQSPKKAIAPPTSTELAVAN